MYDGSSDVGRTRTVGRARRLELVVDTRVVAEVELADTYLRRLRGMLGRRSLPDALLLVPGGSVHGVGMTAALDVAMLAPQVGATPVVGRQGVLATAVLRPFGLVGSRRGVRSVLESPRGCFVEWGVAAGAVVELRPTRLEPFVP